MEECLQNSREKDFQHIFLHIHFQEPTLYIHQNEKINQERGKHEV